MSNYKNGKHVASVRRWTNSAIECYLIGGDCSKCKVAEIIESKCQMKDTIRELVRTLGIPQELKRDDILKD